MINLILDEYNNNRLPLAIYCLDVTIDELYEAIKQINNDKTIYVCKVEYTNRYKEYESGIYITDCEEDFYYIEEQGIFFIPKDFPKIIKTKDSITKENWDKTKTK